MKITIPIIKEKAKSDIYLENLRKNGKYSKLERINLDNY